MFQKPSIWNLRAESAGTPKFQASEARRSCAFYIFSSEPPFGSAAHSHAPTCRCRQRAQCALQDGRERPLRPTLPEDIILRPREHICPLPLLSLHLVAVRPALAERRIGKRRRRRLQADPTGERGRRHHAATFFRDEEATRRSRIDSQCRGEREEQEQEQEGVTWWIHCSRGGSRRADENN